MRRTRVEIAKSAAAVIDATEEENALRVRAMPDNVRRLASNDAIVRPPIVSAGKNGTTASRAIVVGKIDIVVRFIASRGRKSRFQKSK